MPVCRPMMATPLGAAFLFGGIIRSLLPPPCPPWLVAFLCTCLAPIYALSSWKPRSWRMLCRPVAMSAFACRWWIVGGCVAAVLWWMLCHCDRVAWWMLCHLWLLRAWRMLCRHSSRLCRYGRAFRWMLRHHLLLRVGDSFLYRSSSSGGLLFGWLVWSVLPLRVSSVVCGRL